MEIANPFAQGSFFAENAEAFGLVSDAHPITTDTLMISSNGHAADDGMHPPTFAVSAKGVDGLYDGLYSSLLHRSDDNERILRLTFGESEGRQNHPIARYCAALTTTLAYQTLSEMSCEDGKTCAKKLSTVLPDGIDALRDVMRAAVGPRPGTEHFFAVSFCACRVACVNNGVYDLDVFHAGDFSLYVLDEQGLKPLYVCDSDVLEPLDTSLVQYHQLQLTHPEPFMLLLLSKSLTDYSVRDVRAIQERPGLLWRYRMRLEDQIIRLVAAGQTAEELPERMERFFTGRAVGRDSASGAWLLLGGSYDAFRTFCQMRIHALEQLFSLLPKGYDAQNPVTQIPLEQVERGFILTAFRTRPGLVERVMDMISKRAVELLQKGKDAEIRGNGNAPCLTYDEVYRVFASFDAHNRQDREQIAKNDAVMADLLSRQWTTLRPVFCRPPMADDVSNDMKRQSLTAVRACEALKQRISFLLGKRRRMMSTLRERLTSSLEVLDLHGDDWASGVGGEDSALAWFRETTFHIPELVRQAQKDYQSQTHRLRSLQTAYSHERALAFTLDTSEGGVWHTCYTQIKDGELPPDIWRVYISEVQEKCPKYVELLKVLRTISERNRALIEQIENRGAERRMVLTLSGDPDWQVACMLGALWEDAAWGESVTTLLDNGFRNEYKALRRRWMEERELLVRQRDAFEAYRDMYTTYLSLDK